MLDKKRSYARVVSATIVLGLVIASCLWLVLNRTYVQDQLTVWGYTPSADVSQLATELELTNKGTFYFYASTPRIDNADTFNKNCPQQEVNNPILGCYNGQQIFIYNVNEVDLEGIQQVTAAHETLHAIWKRMDVGEQERVGALLRAAYNSIADDDFKQRMSYYERNEPGEFINELHSIIGTEYGSLSPELEQYYSQYFKDRSKIVAYHAQYDTLFTDLESQADALYTELTDLGAQIDTERNTYASDVAALTRDINDFNERAKNGSFSSQSQFYSERAELVARSNQIDQQRDTLNAKIATYNQKVVTYQGIASRIQQLNSSIDSMSTVESAPQLESNG